MSFYALLLSIGYRRNQLERIVLIEGLILSALSLPIALVASQALCMALSSYSSISVALPGSAILLTFLLIIMGCSASSLFAMLRLRDANPADLFG
jgi:ABC-type antimicrobial peptide transport system permease subunit